MRSTLKCDIIFSIIVGDLFMKTKIIYISGNETFEMTQIRAAFEEVRSTLGLDKDTILFGVPVDCDSALSDIQTIEDTTPIQTPEIIPTTQIITDDIVAESETQIVTEPVVAPVAEIIPEPLTEIAVEPVVENIIESVTEVEEDITAVEEPTEEVVPVVPILSVLGGTESDVVADVVAEEPVETAEVVAEPVNVVENVIEEMPVLTDNVADAEPVVITEASVDLEDIADDSIPETPMEKTLEQLLESMTPLREDIMSHDEPVVDTSDDIVDVLPPDDTDATLAQLASEFVQNEDKIPSAPKAETSGKIGKLKNILPFKKAKRDDSGLMGDLFGWAGIAANDEDFAIPGFFTQAASKK